MSVVIQVENLTKCYRLGTIGGGTLRADVSRWLAKLQGKADPNLQIGQEHHARLMGQEFWALQDVTFEVKQGEILGIVGRNGAGKSTLLKILSRVTAPTGGEVRVKGRIASLLEVGTGFHPELSGRENIFLNGAILGMTKPEIRKKFDEIVAFSGVEDFIDTPVKRYSSGMYVRLAFAVAAHLEPEILIVDEVLAVGDAEFQKKCIGKMQDVSAQEGRTVIFVSHNMPAVQSLCQRVILMADGTVQMNGSTIDVVRSYLSLDNTLDVYKCLPDPNKKVTVTSAKLIPDNLPATEAVTLVVTLHARTSISCSMEVIVSDGSGIPIGIGSVGLADSEKLLKLIPGENQFTCQVKLPLLAIGNYLVQLQVALPWVEVYDRMASYLFFECHRRKLGVNHRPLNQNQGHGCLELETHLIPNSHIT
jgi:lipopolysaccharide transport system ATP-binding protein